MQHKIWILNPNMLLALSRSLYTSTPHNCKTTLNKTTTTTQNMLINELQGRWQSLVQLVKARLFSLFLVWKLTVDDKLSKPFYSLCAELTGCLQQTDIRVFLILQSDVKPLQRANKHSSQYVEVLFRWLEVQVSSLPLLLIPCTKTEHSAISVLTHSCCAFSFPFQFPLYI